MEAFDIEAISKHAHARGALVVVDDTFATPVNQSHARGGAKTAAAVVDKLEIISIAPSLGGVESLWSDLSEALDG